MGIYIYLYGCQIQQRRLLSCYAVGKLLFTFIYYSISKMALARLLLLAAAAQKALCIGFSTYEIIFEGQDNSGTVAYSSTYSDTLFLYIQINAGQDHSAIISDFETLCQNYGSQGVSVVPRVCYQEPGTTTISTEPSVATLLPEVSQFAQVFEAVTEYINIPVVQAGFLGQYGEWHVCKSPHLQ